MYDSRHGSVTFCRCTRFPARFWQYTSLEAVSTKLQLPRFSSAESQGLAEKRQSVYWRFMIYLTKL